MSTSMNKRKRKTGNNRTLSSIQRRKTRENYKKWNKEWNEWYHAFVEWKKYENMRMISIVAGDALPPAPSSPHERKFGSFYEEVWYNRPVTFKDNDKIRTQIETFARGLRAVADPYSIQHLIVPENFILDDEEKKEARRKERYLVANMRKAKKKDPDKVYIPRNKRDEYERKAENVEREKGDPKDYNDFAGRLMMSIQSKDTCLGCGDGMDEGEAFIDSSINFVFHSDPDKNCYEKALNHFIRYESQMEKDQEIIIGRFMKDTWYASVYMLMVDVRAKIDLCVHGKSETVHNVNATCFEPYMRDKDGEQEV